MENGYENVKAVSDISIAAKRKLLILIDQQALITYPPRTHPTTHLCDAPAQVSQLPCATLLVAPQQGEVNEEEVDAHQRKDCQRLDSSIRHLIKCKYATIIKKVRTAAEYENEHGS